MGPIKKAIQTGKVVGNERSIQKLIAFLYSGNEQLETEI